MQVHDIDLERERGRGSGGEGEGERETDGEKESEPTKAGGNDQATTHVRRSLPPPPSAWAQAKALQDRPAWAAAPSPSRQRDSTIAAGRGPTWAATRGLVSSLDPVATSPSSSSILETRLRPSRSIWGVGGRYARVPSLPAFPCSVLCSAQAVRTLTRRSMMARCLNLLDDDALELGRPLRPGADRPLWRAGECGE